ncbi:MAG TPA: hypothetical protein VNN62_25145 [Methylomirabilota bacterium]|jgi:hypothetical protein|nr:hypothetical protein [Methylomirabilota bacterium]
MYKPLLVLLLFFVVSGCAVSQNQRPPSSPDEVMNAPQGRRFVRVPRPDIGFPIGIGGIGGGIAGVGGGGACP